MGRFRVITMVRVGADTHEDLHDHAARLGGHVPDQHRGPDGMWRGTVIVSDIESAAIRAWDREHDLVLADLLEDSK